MTEGWSDDDYLILFDQAEIANVTLRYGVEDVLPGFEMVGIRSWDDFIVRDQHGSMHLVPTIPLDAKYLAPFDPAKLSTELRSDERFEGRIKWYVQPLIFGGDPAMQENTVWVSHEEHAALVKWWNKRYRDSNSQLRGA